MLQWILGEKRYVYITVSEASGGSFTIASSTYTVYNTSDESVVTSGTASVDNDTHMCSFLWQPETAGVFVAQFNYVIGLVEMSGRQVIEVKETM